MAEFKILIDITLWRKHPLVPANQRPLVPDMTGIHPLLPSTLLIFLTNL